MVDLDTINTVLRRFLSTSRTPEYLNKPEYAHLIERNKELYLSSAWYQSHWSYEKLQTYCANMMDPTKKYFCCGLPYQISIMEGLLSKEQIEDEFSELDFDEMKFLMEMQALWFGDTDGTFFKYDDVAKRRKIQSSFLPLKLYDSKNIKIPPLAPNERRILSLDVALMGSKKHNNDASSLIINSAIPSSDNIYIANMVYLDSYEDINTDELGLIVMRTFYKYHCTDLVIDTNGQGLGVYDFLIKNQYDPDYGITYPALSCCNNEEMAARCRVKGAKKSIWSIKASAAFNTEICILLRTGIQTGKINLLTTEIEAEEYLSKNMKGYNKKMTAMDKALYKLPYVQTSMLINELINLQSETRGTNIKISEKSGMRKDRYSSIAYNYWAMCQIEMKRRPKRSTGVNLADLLPIRKGKIPKAFG